MINNYFNNSFFFNNYNTNNPSSFFDKNTGIFYNYLKPEKIYVIQNEKYKIKFYLIINNNLGLFFTKINDDVLNNFTKENIYIQINEIYKEAIKQNEKEILNDKIIWIPCFEIYNHFKINEIYKEAIKQNKKEILNDKIIWIPCFEIYKHFKCLSNNGVGTIHEYIKISNKKIKKMNFEQFRINNKDKSQVKIVPDTSRDILFNDDFILGIINNTGNSIDENINENIKKKKEFK